MQVLQNLGPIAVIVIGYVLGVYFQSRALALVEKRIDDSNRRIDDLRLEMIGRITDLREVLRAEMARDRSELLSEMGMFRAEMARNQSELLAKFSELATRIDRLDEPRMVKP